MNDYRILFQQLIKLKEELESELLKINKNISINTSGIADSVTEIERLEKDKKEKNDIYYLLANYKDILNKELKKSVIFGGFMFGAFVVSVGIALLFVSVVFKEIIANGALIGLASSLIIGVISGVSTYLNNTKQHRELYKENISMLPYFPIMIATLDKQIHFEYESKAAYLADMKNSIKEREMLNTKLEKCNAYIEFLQEKALEVEYACRHDNDAIKEVYEEDLEIGEAIKLVREKGKRVDIE